jgi:hypothetical protein
MDDSGSCHFVGLIPYENKRGTDGQMRKSLLQRTHTKETSLDDVYRRI